MSEVPQEQTDAAPQIQEGSQPQEAPTESAKVEIGIKRPRSNSLEATAAQALTQLDGPPPQQRQASTGAFQPTLGPPQPIQPTQYANAFSAGQGAAQQQAQQQQQPQQQQQQQTSSEQQQAQGTQQMHQTDMQYVNAQMPQQIIYRPPMGSQGASMQLNQGGPMPGRAPGAHQARQRTAVACRYCRKRKIRCTGISHDPNDPRCANCRRLDQECIYAPVGAPQGNYTRQPMQDNYGRNQQFQQMPPHVMMQGQQQMWQQHPQMGYPPYVPYPPGQAPPGPDGQHHFPPGPHFMPVQGYPMQGQTYQYDNTIPPYVGGSNNQQNHGQFGRLKPETVVVYASPSQNHSVMHDHGTIGVIDPAVQQEDMQHALQHENQGQQQDGQQDQSEAQVEDARNNELEQTGTAPKEEEENTAALQSAEGGPEDDEPVATQAEKGPATETAHEQYTTVQGTDGLEEATDEGTNQIPSLPEGDKEQMNPAESLDISEGGNTAPERDHAEAATETA